MAMDVANRLSAIVAKMGQLQNEIQKCRIALNLFLRNVKSKRSVKAEEHIGAAREKIREK